MKRLLIVGLMIAAMACSSKHKEQAFLDSVGQLSKEQILAKADTYLADGDREEARRYYSFLSDSFPNDPIGRQAALKVADSYFAGKDTESLAEAQLRYKDYSNRFPNDPNRAYALLQLGKTYAKQRRGPLRDLTPTHEAAAAFQQVLDLAPTSPYAEQARELLNECKEELAQHEFLVAKYYFSSRGWQGAHLRLTYLIATYPDAKTAVQAREMLAKVDAALAAHADAMRARTAGTEKPGGAPSR